MYNITSLIASFLQDLTKKVVGTTTSGFEGVVKTVTRNEDYQCK